MFCRRCSSGIHFLHNVLPQGRVTGSCRGYGHCGHCASLTISRASLEASRGPFSGVMSMVEVSGTLGMDRRGKGVLLRGMEDITSRFVQETSAGLLERLVVVEGSQPTIEVIGEAVVCSSPRLFPKFICLRRSRAQLRCLKWGIRSRFVSSRLVSFRCRFCLENAGQAVYAKK
jgi:hypothetical protein